MNAALHNVSLAELKRSLGKAAATPSVSLGGLLNAEANASWGKTFNDLAAQADATVHGLIAGSGNIKVANATTALDSEIHAKLHGEEW